MAVTQPTVTGTLLALCLLATTAPAQTEIGVPAPPGWTRAANVVVPQTGNVRVRPGANTIAIESVDARVSIDGQTARTSVQVNLRNSGRRPDEAVILLPVPPGAVVSGFAFSGGASEPLTEVLTADEARRIYDSIVARTRDPALLEFAGWGLLRSSVFPVPAGGTQKVRVTYEHLLERDGDRIDYVLPRSESLERRRPWTIEVDVLAARPISTVYSPSHEIVAERGGPERFAVRLAAGATHEPGPFRLSYLLADASGVSASMFAYPGPAAGGGYFLLLAGLPASVDDLAGRIMREVTIVIDRSGSMAGDKMDQVRAAALQVIEGLAPGEAFNIIDYASTVESFAAAPVIKGDRSAAEARAYLAALRPVGGTNIHDALLEALRQAPREGMLPIVLFLTDGLPTIGRTRETEIRRVVAEANPHERRVFTFGVGADVNAPLLDRVAEASRAASTFVLPGADVEVEVARVFRRLYGPVLAGPALTTATSDAESTRLVGELIPAAIPDLFDGDQLVLLGQYRSEGPITFRLDGNFLGEERRFEFTFDMARASARHAFVPRLWASRRIAELIDQIRQAGAEAAENGTSGVDARYGELVNEIVRLSTTFGILTEYTSFLAREGTDLSDFEDLVAGCGAELSSKAVATRSGVAALNQSLNMSRQKGQAWLNYGNAYVTEELSRIQFNDVQQLCNRAFFRRGDRWIDSRVIEAPEPDRTVVMGTPEHAQLLERLVREGRQGLMSLPGEILIDVDGAAVLVKNDDC